MPSLGLSLSLTARFRGSGPRFNPAQLFSSSTDGCFFDPNVLSAVWSDTAGTTAAGLGGLLRRMDDLSGNGNNATSSTAWALRRDATYSAQRDGGTFSVTLPDLGADATVAYVDHASGVTILTGQTIGAGSYALPTSARLGPVIIIDRALTAPETAALTTWLTARRPGNWLLGLGVWDDAGAWTDTAFWQTAA